MTTGEMIAKMRRDNHYSQEEFAERMTVSWRSVSYWESDIEPPDIENLEKMCKLFHCSIEDLMNKTDHYTTKDQNKDDVNRESESEYNSEIDSGNYSEYSSESDSEYSADRDFEYSCENDSENVYASKNQTLARRSKIGIRGDILCSLIAFIILTILVVVFKNSNSDNSRNSAQNSIQTEEQMDVQIYESKDALLQGVINNYKQYQNGKTISFEIKELTMPFEVTETRYESPGPGHARIIYKSVDQEIEYNTYYESNKQSTKDYDEMYGEETVSLIGNYEVNVRHNKNENCTWAEWQNGSLQYELIFQSPVSNAFLGYLVNQTNINPEAIQTMKQYESITLMTPVLGFPVDDIMVKDIEAQATNYYIYYDQMAAVKYEGVSYMSEVTICKSEKFFDIIEDYYSKINSNIFKETNKRDDIVVNIDEIEVTLKCAQPTIKQYLFACWTSGDFNYVVRSGKYTSDDDLLSIAKKVIEQENNK